MTHSLRAGAIVALLLAPGSADAQARGSQWMPSIGGGRIDWNATALSTTMSGPDDATAIVLRGSRNVIRRVVGFEWGVSYASFAEPQFLDPTQTLAVDWRVTLHTPWQSVQPFVGVGPSAFMYGTNARDRNRFEAGYNAGGGVRVMATPGLVLILDARLRGWDFSGNEQWTAQEAGEVTLSLGFRR